MVDLLSTHNVYCEHEDKIAQFSLNKLTITESWKFSEKKNALPGMDYWFWYLLFKNY